jgi:DNA-binding response OmpR family regulator
MKKILIVEDESLVALDLSQSVESLGYEVVGIVSNSKDAIELTCKEKVDLVLMDICIKGDTDGIDTAKAIKIYDKNIQIIYSTALSGEEDIKRAVKTNPSAYIIKPVGIHSLQAAMEIALMSCDDEECIKGDIVLDDEFSYDSDAEQLICSGKFINLTKRERQLLNLFISCANNVVSLYDIENEIWPDKNFNVNTTRALISRLRAKLKYKIIETIPSLGYRVVLK